MNQTGQSHPLDPVVNSIDDVLKERPALERRAEEINTRINAYHPAGEEGRDWKVLVSPNVVLSMIDHALVVFRSLHPLVQECPREIAVAIEAVREKEAIAAARANKDEETKPFFRRKKQSTPRDLPLDMELLKRMRLKLEKLESHIQPFTKASLDEIEEVRASLMRERLNIEFGIRPQTEIIVNTLIEASDKLAELPASGEINQKLTTLSQELRIAALSFADPQSWNSKLLKIKEDLNDIPAFLEPYSQG